MAERVLEKPFGGELAWHADAQTHCYLTDSGRSSIRLILRSGFGRMRFLLPDYVCEVVPRLFDELDVRYGFYRVREDLTIDPASLADKSFDVLYVVDYFGQAQEYRRFVGEQTWIVSDCVFSPELRAPRGRGRWIGFNSFRKISALTDGSLVQSTVALDEALIERSQAPFVAAKARAKRTKWEYLNGRGHDEALYLRGLEHGEAMLDAQAAVHRISAGGLCQLLDFQRGLNRELRIRRRNFALLGRHLDRWALPLKTRYPCLYVLRVERRDELREHLRGLRIFLPVHWPNLRGFDNPLYRKIISIPVDSRYSEADLQRVAQAIEEFQARA